MNPKTNKIAMVAQKVLIVAAAMVLIDGCELYTDLYTCIYLHFFLQWRKNYRGALGEGGCVRVHFAIVNV